MRRRARRYCPRVAAMTDAELEAMAARAHPHNEAHRRKWLAAVQRLRAGRGWVHDGKTGFRLVPQDEQAPKFAGRVVPIKTNLKTRTK